MRLISSALQTSISTQQTIATCSIGEIVDDRTLHTSPHSEEPNNVWILRQAVHKDIILLEPNLVLYGIKYNSILLSTPLALNNNDALN